MILVNFVQGPSHFIITPIDPLFDIVLERTRRFLLRLLGAHTKIPSRPA